MFSTKTTVIIDGTPENNKPSSTDKPNVGTNQPGSIARAPKIHPVNANAIAERAPIRDVIAMKVGPPKSIATPSRVNASAACDPVHPLSSSRRVVRNPITNKYINPNAV